MNKIGIPFYIKKGYNRREWKPRDVNNTVSLSFSSRFVIVNITGTGYAPVIGCTAAEDATCYQIFEKQFLITYINRMEDSYEGTHEYKNR